MTFLLRGKESLSTDLSPPWWRPEDYNPTLESLPERQDLGLASLIGLAGRPRRAIRARSPQSSYRKVLAVGLLTGAIIGFVLAIHMAQAPQGSVVIRLGWYGTAVMTLLSLKLLLSLLAAPVRSSKNVDEVLARYKVAGIITCRNEDPAAFARCLSSILDSTRLPTAVTVIDDGSTSLACYEIAHTLAPAFRAVGVDYEVIVFPENLGKRAGLAAGFRRTWDADVYLCVDSDTILHPEAIANALRPFKRQRVHATTGAVFAANRSANTLTRLIDLRYCYAFLGERAAYSVLGSVLCACGSLALYRGATVRKSLTTSSHSNSLAFHAHTATIGA